MALGKKEAAKGLALMGVVAALDPTAAAAVAVASIEAAVQLVPDATAEREMAAVVQAVEKALPKGVLHRDGFETARAVVRGHFKGTRDLYEVPSNETLAERLLARYGRPLAPQHAKRTRQYLMALLGGFRETKAEVEALERFFRRDVRDRLADVQQRVGEIADGNASAAEALADLRAWVRNPLLYDPREEFWRWRDRDDVRSPAALFNAYAERVPFFGREAETEAFDAWLEADDRFDVWVIEGPGGIGKTRFMLEMLDRARAQDWQAGFLQVPSTDREADATEAVASSARALLRGERPVLAVVDYAENRPLLTVALLQAWKGAGGPPRRLVLLCRRQRLLLDALDQHEDRPSLSHVRAFIERQAVRFDQAVLSLPPERRRAAFEDAQTAFYAVQPEATPFSADELDEAFFAHAHFGRALFLHIAAYTSLAGRPKVRKADLLNAVLDRERQHLTRLLRTAVVPKQVKGKHLWPALALATLALAARSERDGGTIPPAETFLEHTPSPSWTVCTATPYATYSYVPTRPRPSQPARWTPCVPTRWAKRWYTGP